jgi:hypothetical protein
MRSRCWFVLILVSVLAAAALPAAGSRAAPAGQPSSGERPLAIAGRDPAITAATVSGPRLFEPEQFQGFEDFHNPRLKRIRSEYRLDQVVAGETDEFRKLLRLRHWVNRRWPIDNDQNFSGDAFAILEKAKTGAGFHCSHCMTVQHALFTAMGFVARRLGVDRNHEDFGKSIHHGVNEVWSNQYAKWVLLDAKYDHHFERDGVPLSALEIHDAVRADGGRGVKKVVGIERKEVPMEDPAAPEASVRGYWWISYYLQQNSFSQPHWAGNNRLLIPDDAGFRQTTWYRGGDSGLVKHWAYGAGAFIPVRDRRELEWTPGVVELRVRQEGPRELAVDLHSATPNLQCYRVRVNGGEWRSVEDSGSRWRLKSGSNRLEARTRNLFGVEGPVATATVGL